MHVKRVCLILSREGRARAGALGRRRAVEARGVVAVMMSSREEGGGGVEEGGSEEAAAAAAGGREAWKVE
jgi:hypothetical protein